MPYFVFRDNREDEEGFCGLALSIGYIEQEHDFQIALTIGYYTVAIGLDFNNYTGRYW